MVDLFFLGIYDDSMKVTEENVKYFLWIESKKILVGRKALDKAKKIFSFDFNSTISKFGKTGSSNQQKGMFSKNDKSFFYLSKCVKGFCFQLIIHDKKLNQLSQLPSNLSVVVQNYKKMIDDGVNGVEQFILNNLNF